jgi:hypothetical protein
MANTKAIGLATFYGALVLCAGLAAANHVSEKVSNFIFAYVILYMLWIHFFLSILIGLAAERRNCGLVLWILGGCFFSPLLAWIVYLIFVSWRPIVPKSPGEQTA